MEVSQIEHAIEKVDEEGLNKVAFFIEEASAALGESSRRIKHSLMVGLAGHPKALERFGITISPEESRVLCLDNELDPENFYNRISARYLFLMARYSEGLIVFIKPIEKEIVIKPSEEKPKSLKPGGWKKAKNNQPQLGY